MISVMDPLRKERETLDWCPGWLRAIGSGLGWIIFLPVTIYDWAESNWDESSVPDGVGGGLAGAAHGEGGCLIALGGLIVRLASCRFGWLTADLNSLALEVRSRGKRGGSGLR